MGLESKTANYFISKTFYYSGYPFVRDYITGVPFGYAIALIHHQLVNSVKATQHLKLKVA